MCLDHTYSTPIQAEGQFSIVSPYIIEVGEIWSTLVGGLATPNKTCVNGVL